MVLRRHFRTSSAVENGRIVEEKPSLHSFVSLHCAPDGRYFLQTGFSRNRSSGIRSRVRFEANLTWMSTLTILQLMILMHGESDRHPQFRYKWDSVPHSARRISVGSVRSARSTAGSVARSAVSRMAHAGSAIISASVALTW